MKIIRSARARASEWTLASLASRSESEIALFQPNSPGLGSIGEALDYYYYYYSDAAAVLLPIYIHICLSKDEDERKMVYKKKKSVLQRERLGLKTDRTEGVRGVRKKKVLGRYMDGSMNESTCA